MSELNRFLKVLNKVGYPNPDTTTIAKMIDYNLDEFLPGLVDELGQEKSNDFVSKAIKKLSSEKGVRINISNDEYVYFIIHNPHIDLNNDIRSVIAEFSFGDSKLLHQDDEGNEVYKTIEEIYEDIGMGEWGDFNYMLDGFREDCSKYIHNNCGFFMWWQE
jgi:hypothetical protein